MDPREMVLGGLYLADAGEPGLRALVVLLLDYRAFGQAVADDAIAGRLSMLLRTGPDEDIHPVLVHPRDTRAAVLGNDLTQVFRALLSLRGCFGELTDAVIELPARTADVTREVLCTMRHRMPVDLRRTVELLRRRAAEVPRPTER